MTANQISALIHYFLLMACPSLLINAHLVLVRAPFLPSSIFASQQLHNLYLNNTDGSVKIIS
jgi:hypothetical protein